MKEYISLFATHSEYNAAKNNLDKPNVAYCIDQNEVHYNPLDYSKDYLTFDILTDGTIDMYRNGGSYYERILYYSRDNGSTWTSIIPLNDGASIEVSTGDKLLFKGNNTYYGAVGDYDYYNRFGSTAEYNVSGNILSLIYGDNFINYNELPQQEYSNNSPFMCLFGNSKVVSAKNLVLPLNTTIYCYYRMFNDCTYLIEPPKLPATTLSEHCYEMMFQNCTSLEVAPTLPATTLVENCYEYMFATCTNLNYIKCLATDISANSCTRYWVDGVQTTSGIFVGNPDANQIWSRGNNGIPFNWTAQPQSIESVML